MRTRKPQYRYLVAAGTRNRLYCPLEDPADLVNPDVDVWFVEGEKKYLSLRAFAEKECANGFPRFIPVGLFGVWGFRSITGIIEDKDGHRVSVKGVINDIEKFRWECRRAIILYDSNVLWNDSVQAARVQLARELEGHGAEVYFINLPVIEGVNGVDDFLAREGPEKLKELAQQAIRFDWREELMRTEKGKIIPQISAVTTAFRLAPAWCGVLAYNEFAERPEALKPPPWGGGIGPWGDYADVRATEWMERHGIRVSVTTVGKAALTVARDHPFHPVKDYLDSLRWDGVPRLDMWVMRYLGVKVDPDDQTEMARLSDFQRAAGVCWMISAIARIYQPGCKVDHVLILKGPQGTLKSTVFSTLGGEFFSDDLADLGSKDSSLGAAGAWIIELAELAAMAKPEVEKIKAFISRATDRFRPPYGHYIEERPRSCVFGGSVNSEHFLRDDTGNRRFWPIECGEIDIEGLKEDRDQLWAEARVRYEKGEHWWLETPELVETAISEQEEAYAPHPWEADIKAYLDGQIAAHGAKAEVTTADILRGPCRKEIDKWTRGDETNVGYILARLKWVKFRPHGRQRVYRPTEAAIQALGEDLNAKGASNE
jgi:predicted P-loop ATPase